MSVIRSLPRLLMPLAIVACGGAMAAATWMGWTDPVIDFGRELYIPWRITEGQVLYRDIAYFNGPLSPYLNSAAFAVLGVSMRTLVIMNLAILGIALALVYRLAAAAAGRLSAVAACLTFIFVFAFAQYLKVANFNWMSPYSHEMTHGTTLGLAMLWCCWNYWQKQDARWLAAAGLATGLALLTKIEIATAVTGALVVALLLTRNWRAAAIAGAAAAVPVLIAFLLLGEQVLGGWLYMLDPSHHIGDPYHAHGTGLDAPVSSLLQMGKLLAIECVLVVTCMLAAWSLWSGILGTILAIAVLWKFRGGFEGMDSIALALPLVMLLLGAIAFANWRKQRGDARHMLALTAVAFAMLMLLKMILRARWSHYGFALALPATLVAVVAVIGLLPRRTTFPGLYLAMALALCATVIVPHVQVTLQFTRAKTLKLGAGNDAFRIDPKNELITITLKRLLERASPGDTLAVMPEGVMLNYLARMPASTPYSNFIPHEVHLYGESNMMNAFAANPPQWVVLMHRDTTEYGYRFFGKDYAKDLMQWVHGHYVLVHPIGPPPFEEAYGGAQIARHIDPVR